MTDQKFPFLPGLRLRALRTACGKSQLEVELEANLGIGYLQRLERGKVQRPERETLERILVALGVSFAERCNVLRLFGYCATLCIPNQVERQWAIELFRAEHEQDGIPVYLLDCSHRLLAWNSLVGRVFEAVDSLSSDMLLPKLVFDPTYQITPSVLNADAFFAAEIRIVQFERQRWNEDGWYEGFIDDMRQYPTFDRYWSQYAGTGREQIPLRPVAHLKVLSGHAVTQFRLISETFGADPRFRVIYYMPADPVTMRQCLEWQS